MQALTLGIGSWRDLAERSAARMQEMTGVPCKVIGDEHVKDLDLPHPAWAKLWVFDWTDSAAVMVFDADLWCLREWEPKRFWVMWNISATTEPWSRQINSEAVEHDIPIWRYFNTGLMIMPYTTAIGRALDAAKDLRPKYGRWYEQTAICKTMHTHGVSFNEMPQRYNHLLWPGRDSYDPERLSMLGAVNLHFASLNDPQRIGEIIDTL